MNNLMVDLESLDTKPTSAITSIGAVFFDENGIGRTFYRRVNPQSCVDLGLTISLDTIFWWMEQNEDARAELIKAYKEGLSIQQALTKLSNFIREEFYFNKSTDINSLRIWGNGATFDNVILKNAYEACYMRTPWGFRGDMCYRTIKNLYPDVPFKRSGTAHNALDDAISQAKHLIKIGEFMGEGDCLRAENKNVLQTERTT